MFQLVYDLGVCFVIDDGLEVVNYGWVGVWVCYCVDDIEGVVYIGDLVVQGFVYGVFQCVGIGCDWNYFGVQQFYVEDVGCLVFYIGGVYENCIR